MEAHQDKLTKPIKYVFYLLRQIYVTIVWVHGWESVFGLKEFGFAIDGTGWKPVRD